MIKNESIIEKDGAAHIVEKMVESLVWACMEKICRSINKEGRPIEVSPVVRDKGRSRKKMGLNLNSPSLGMIHDRTLWHHLIHNIFFGGGGGGGDLIVGVDLKTNLVVNQNAIATEKKDI